jgi:dTDP-4-dehydrorhamnose reductase
VIRVLLTGARGQVGTELARELGHRCELVACDRESLDLADPDAIAARMREVRPRVIVNCAAYTAVDRAETDRDAARAVNGTGPGVLAEEARKLGALLVHFSTDYVFDGTKASPYAEDDPVNPLSAYGASKLDGERAIAASGAEHLILRTSWVYGPHGKNFLFTMLRLGRERDELRVVDDQRGAPTSSTALARLVRELLGATGSQTLTEEGARAAAGRSGLYHATAEGATSWFGFAQAIFDEMGRQRRLDFTPPRLVAILTEGYPTPARRPANSVLSSERLRSTFGTSISDWRQGLRETVSALPL